MAERKKTTPKKAAGADTPEKTTDAESMAGTESQGAGDGGAADGGVPMIRVTTRRDGFRRAGRAWFGTTEVRADEITEEQLAAIEAEPMLTVVKVTG